MKSFDYAGKTVNIGIDVHKKTYKVCAMVDGEVVKKWTCVAKPKELAEAFRRFFPGAEIRSIYEAGFSGFVLHRILEAEGFKSIVVNASSIEIAANDRVKTDKRDAKKLAATLSQKNPKGIHIPTPEEELRRLLPRTRAQFVERRTGTGNRIKSKLFQFGLIDPEDDRQMSNAYLERVEKLVLPFELKFVLQELIDDWRVLSLRIKQVEQEMAIQAEKESAREKILRSVPGVGPVTSRILSTELGDMSRFSGEKHLFSFTGMTPSEDSSGENVRRGHISRQGPGRLRSTLVEAAWRAIGEDPELRKIYERIKARRQSKIAIVAVARHLTGRIRACLIRGEEYRFRVSEPPSVSI